MRNVFSTPLFVLKLANVEVKMLFEQAYATGARAPESLPTEYRQQPTHAFCGAQHIIKAKYLNSKALFQVILILRHQLQNA